MEYRVHLFLAILMRWVCAQTVRQLTFCHSDPALPAYRQAGAKGGGRIYNMNHLRETDSSPSAQNDNFQTI